MYTLDDDLKNNEMQTTGGSGTRYEQLPFDAPLFAWRHGDPAFPNTDTKHFGRWAIGVEKFDPFAEANDLAVPKLVEEHPQRDQNGRPVSDKYYSIYTFRYLIFAPVAIRKRWTTVSQVQALVHLAEKRDDQLVPTHLAVLSAKVFSSSQLEGLINQWFKHIEKFEPGIPPQYFYMAVGTFGDKSKFEGTHGTTTLPQLFVNPKLTKDSLPFVGQDIARKMADAQLNAQAWLNDEAWLNPNSEKSEKPYAPSVAEDIPF